MGEAAKALIGVIDYTTPMLRQLDATGLTVHPAPGKWSVQEILGHLVDSAANNHQKFVRSMQQPVHDFPIYEQDAWVATQQYNDVNWQDLVTLWEAYNRHLAHIMNQVTTTQLQHRLTISGKGPFTLQFIMPDYVEHLKHHLKAIFKDDPFFDNHFKMVY